MAQFTPPPLKPNIMGLAFFQSFVTLFLLTVKKCTFHTLVLVPKFFLLVQSYKYKYVLNINITLNYKIDTFNRKKINKLNLFQHINFKSQDLCNAVRFFPKQLKIKIVININLKKCLVTWHTLKESSMQQLSRNIRLVSRTYLSPGSFYISRR